MLYCDIDGDLERFGKEKKAMTVNYYIKCPVCGAITRMRSPAGYIYRTPVRIHCGRCNTLLTGHFISDNKCIKAFYEADNTIEVSDKNSIHSFDYYGEASGELLTHKCCEKSEIKSDMMPFLSPAMIALNQIAPEDNEAFINYICYLEDISTNWDSINLAYNLFISHRYDIIKSYCKKEALQSGYTLLSEFQIHRFFHAKLYHEVAGLWKPQELKKLLKDIHFEFLHLKKSERNQILTILPKETLLEIEAKMFSIIFNYIQLSLYLAPAISVFYYRNPQNIDYKEYGLSTCSFQDIKNFYQDTFEDLARYCHVIKMLDNIKYRGDWNDFGNKRDLQDFLKSHKGNRIKDLDTNEFFCNTFGLDASSNSLRNAIGHNNYTYDGIKQIVDYVPNDKKPNIHKQYYLLEITQDCLKSVRSAVVLEFCIYELLRELYRNDEAEMHLAPWFYKGISAQRHCPCGSMKKYGRCCRDWVKEQSILEWKYPQKACMRMDVSSFLKKFNH